MLTGLLIKMHSFGDSGALKDVRWSLTHPYPPSLRLSLFHRNQSYADDDLLKSDSGRGFFLATVALFALGSQLVLSLSFSLFICTSALRRLWM